MSLLTLLLLLGCWGGSSRGAELQSSTPAETSDGPCSTQVLLSCQYPEKVEKGIRFATSDEELNENCPYLHDGLRCIDNYTRSCLEPAKRSAFYRSYTGSAMVLQEICAPGPYREEFLRLAPCMNNATEEYFACAKPYQKALQRFSSTKEIPAEMCGELKRYVSCSESVMRQTCGNEAAIFTAGFLHRMTENIFKEHCPVTEDSSSRTTSGVLFSFIASALAYFLS